MQENNKKNTNLRSWAFKEALILQKKVLGLKKNKVVSVINLSAVLE